MAKTARRPFDGRYGPWVPVELLLRVLDEHVPAELQRARCEAAGVGGRTLSAWRAGERAWVRFETADRVVTAAIGDGSLWHTDAELSVVYGRS